MKFKFSPDDFQSISRICVPNKVSVTLIEMMQREVANEANLIIGKFPKIDCQHEGTQESEFNFKCRKCGCKLLPNWSIIA